MIKRDDILPGSWLDDDLVTVLKFGHIRNFVVQELRENTCPFQRSENQLRITMRDHSDL